MGKSRRRIALGLRPSAAREEKIEEPAPGALCVTEEADDFHERRLEEAVLAALGSDEEEESEEEEEVLGLELAEEDETDEDEEGENEEGGDDDNDDEPPDMDSDLEEKRVSSGGSGLPDELAWGQRKQLYYGTDYGKAPTRSKAGKKSREETEAEELEEEEEAQAIQKRLAQNLGEDDYGLDLLQGYTRTAEQPSEKDSGKKIAKDLQSLSKKEQLKLLKKESPELLELIQDFEAKVTELRDELEPLMQMVRKGVIPQGKGSQYLQTKYHLYLNYCCNISFYLVLKAKRIPVHGHPVIERLLTYRNLINDLGVVDEKLSPEVRLLLNEFNSNDSDGIEGKKKSRVSVRNLVNKRKPKTIYKIPNGDADEEPTDDSDLDEEAALNYYKEMEEKIKLEKKKKREKMEDVETLIPEEEIPGQKRGATYQIVKNKGLTPKRKKIDRNPRVKHREKFRRAKIRRKGQVREVRTEEQRYGGELSGIRAGVKKSIKLK
ncbi:Something about silencing protein 10 [Varanus komodoensis]|uniref:UTP3 small subunit processome component n=1 Tax=Varanus komodoensis TaxID=61221 RepID=A0A8D2Q9C8_VARKO|nr:something about silencing protein 10 [Varanus komodoensis]KAF7252582.1 Something about silencing protein 10 [Varanus komodoensis]